jgi:putative tryptophan/tyrosine transport system substrate-binding protein
MRRRDFIAGLVGAAWSSSLNAQSARYRVGMLDTTSRQLNANFDALAQVLRERGYVEGQNLAFEYRSADGNNESFAELARDLVRLNVDVVVTRGTPAALAAKAATTTIPVVMAAAGDPLGIIRGVSGPISNLTGFGATALGMEGKRVAILNDMLPNVARIGAIMNLSNPSRRAEWNAIAGYARSLRIEPQVLDTRTLADIERSFDSASQWHADALVVGSDTLMQSNQSLVVALAASHRMPAMYTFRDFVDAGGLVSYGVSLPELYRRAAIYVDLILKGARPDQLPVEQPSKFEMVINLKAAQALGITVPGTLLSGADEVIR